MRRTISNKSREPLKSLDDIYSGIHRIRSRLNSLSSLFMCASTDENGLPDLDDKMVGLGEMLKDYCDELKSYNTQISKYALKFEKSKGKPRV